jgi:hypothetical protein
MPNFISNLSLTVAILFLSSILSAQQFNFQPPVDIPIYLSGNFGELRGTHFHSGIDIKTQGKIGKKIIAIEKGYVSRVKIKSGGYGHAIYIKHPNGYTSVYGHLSSFFSEMEVWIKEQQYKKKSFEIDQSFSKDRFPVKKGQVIALSGSTGRSSGPHLHFEIRNQNEVPLNVLQYKLPVIDTIAPVFMNLVVYNGFDLNTYTHSSKQVLRTYSNSKHYTISKPVIAQGNVAFGVEIYDFLNGSANKCGVYSLDFFIDGEIVYSMKIDKVSFGESRYTRSHCDYAEKKLKGKSIHRLLIEPNNRLSIYDRKFNNSILVTEDTATHNCKVIATDVYGNISELSFQVISKKPEKKPEINKDKCFADYKSEYVLQNDSLKFIVPKGGLYSSKFIQIQVKQTDNNYYSSQFTIGDPLYPLHKYPKLSLKVTKNLSHLQPEKLIIARYDNSGRVVNEGGRWQNGWISSKVDGFGKYAVIADTTAPSIRAISFRQKGWYAAGDKLVFKITDDLSGIKTYNGYIDDKWVLFEFDAKSNNLFYVVDSERLDKTNGLHELKIYVMDERNNVQSFKGSFYY